MADTAHGRNASGLRVVHVGELDMSRDTGSSMAVEALIEGQVELGMRVGLVTSSPIGSSSTAWLAEAGVTVLRHSAFGTGAFVGHRAVAAEIRRLEPTVVHYHSGFVPLHPLTAQLLSGAFVITPHGAYARQVLRRGQIKKAIYLSLLEKRFLARTGAAIALTADEAAVLGDAFDLTDRTIVVPNALPSRKLHEADQIAATRERKRAVGPPWRGIFLGRLDVANKGLDTLAHVAREANRLGAPIHIFCYGPRHRVNDRNLRSLEAISEGGLSFHEPVYGDAKRNVLAEADFYIQLSRWEAFGMAVAEALAAGLPTVVSESMAIAADLRTADAAEVVPTDPKSVANLVANLFGPRRDRLLRLSERGRAYVRGNLSPPIVAARTMSAYHMALSRLASGAGSS